MLFRSSPPVSGSRTHRVVAQVRDKLHNSTSWSTYEWTIDVLEDTGSGTPALPNSAISLALVTVAAGQTSVTDSNIQDFRPSALSRPGRPRVVADSATRPVRPVEGEEIWRQDLDDVEFYDGSAWQRMGLTRPYAILTTGSNQNVATATSNAVSFNTEVADSHNGHSVADATVDKRYVAPQAGVYRVAAAIPWVNSTAAGKFEVGFRINGGTTWAGGTTWKGTDNVTVVVNGQALLRLNAGDYVEVIVWQGTGSTRTIDKDFNGGPRFEILWERSL